MFTIKCLKEYPNIINKINDYLEPIIIKDNIELSLRNYPSYNKKFHYLIKHNIIIKYALDYAKYPEKTMPFLYELSKIMPINYAYEILMNIPFKNVKIYHINDINNEKLVTEIIKLLHYNYTWAYVLFRKNISCVMIMDLLNKFHDFYFFELCYINNNYNDLNISYGLMINQLNYTEKYKNNFYKLRLAKVPHSMAYKLSRMENIFIDKIVDISNYGYHNAELLEIICYFDEKQINFLKLSRFGFINEDEFNKYKNNMVQKAFFEELFDDTYLNQNIDFKQVNSSEPLNKKMRVS